MNPLVLMIYLSKGGVGKSTLTALLGQYMAAQGLTVAIIDFDRQGSQSLIFELLDDHGLSGEVLHLVLKRRVDILTALTPIRGDLLPELDGHTPGRLFVVQGGPQTKEAIDDIVANPVRYKIANTLDILRQPVASLAGQVDVVLIDMGPSDQVSAIAGLVASDHVLIPTTADYLSVSRIVSVLDEIDVARQAQPHLDVLGIVPVMANYYFGKLRASKSFQTGMSFLEESYGELLLKDDSGHRLDIPYNEAWRDVMWAGLSLLNPDVNKKARADALRFLQAVTVRLGMEV